LINSKPLVSIIIPVYNREKYIIESIDSAINQTYTNIEVIIVDNCSTDNTWAVLEKLASSDNRIKIYRNDKNVGPVLNWEKCINYASGVYLKILWSDDLISTDYLEKTLKLFEENIAFVFSGYDIFDDESKSTIYSSSFNFKNYSVKYYLNQNILYNSTDFPVSPGACIFRRKDITDCLILDIPNSDNIDFKKTGAGNDLLLMLLIANKYPNAIIACLKENLSKFRSHKNSISIQNRLDLNYEYARMYFVDFYSKELRELYSAKIFLLKLFNKKYISLYNLYNNNKLLSFVLLKYSCLKIYNKAFLKINKFFSIK